MENAIDKVLGYIAEGMGGNWPSERFIAWQDQLERSGHAVMVLQEAAARFVASARFPVIADFLDIAKTVAIEVRQKEREREIAAFAALPRGPVAPEDQFCTWKERCARLGLPEGTTVMQAIALLATEDAKRTHVMKTVKHDLPSKNIDAERLRQKRALFNGEKEDGA